MSGNLSKLKSMYLCFLTNGGINTQDSEILFKNEYLNESHKPGGFYLLSLNSFFIWLSCQFGVIFNMPAPLESDSWIQAK